MRPLAAAVFVLVVAPLFAGDGLSGFAVPVVILALGFALAKHRVVPDPWRFSDQDLDAWLDSDLRSPGPGRSSR
jgi:hypothetical protein